MKKLLLMTLLLASFPTFAKNCQAQLMNKISLQLYAKQWVTTKTALVSASINASVTDKGIEQVQANVLQQLSQFSNKGEWHIVSYNRQQDKSGLESIQIIAQARLPQSDLTDLRGKAKAISKPGETYTIDDVQFTPSDDEINQANIVLRNNIYQQAKTEIDTLNKVYSTQKYYLHDINFNAAAPLQTTAPTAMYAKSSSAAPLAVGNQVELQAIVVIASLPDVMIQKPTTP